MKPVLRTIHIYLIHSEHTCEVVCLNCFVLMLYIPVNKFTIMSGHFLTPCTFLELSDTIPESADLVGILTLRRYNSTIVPILLLH